MIEDSSWSNTPSSIGIVLLSHNEEFVAQIPLLNFQAFAPQKVQDLVEVSESDTERWKLYTYDISALTSGHFVEQWSRWMTHRDLHGLVTGEYDDCDLIHNYILEAELIQDIDYRDALVDAWVKSLEIKAALGVLDEDHLRDHSHSKCVRGLEDLKGALILHHDAEAALTEDEDECHYDRVVCEQVRRLALNYFRRPEREPQDPHQLSKDEFCKIYHNHHKENLPCYKTKTLPEER